MFSFVTFPEISIALAEGKPHPKYEQMMARCDEARSRMEQDVICRAFARFKTAGKDYRDRPPLFHGQGVFRGGNADFAGIYNKV